MPQFDVHGCNSGIEGRDSGNGCRRMCEGGANQIGQIALDFSSEDQILVMMEMYVVPEHSDLVGMLEAESGHGEQGF